MTTGNQASSSFVAHEPVSTDFVMVALASTERAGGVGPGAVSSSVASCAASKALALHGFDKVVEGAAIGTSGVGPGGIDLHSHRVSSRSSGLGAWGVASGSDIADGVVPSTSQVNEFLQGGRFLGEFCDAQPLMYGVGEAILKLVFKVPI